MPFLTITNLAANAVADFMTDAAEGAQSKRFIQADGSLQFAIDSPVALAAELEIVSQFRNIVPRGVVQGGGAAGVPPSMTDFGQAVPVLAGEIIEVRIRELLGVATSDFNFNYDIL